MTGRDLVTSALRLIGAVAPGESVPASDAVDGLASINRMLDSWSNENLIIHVVSIDEKALTPGESVYEIGDDADWDTPRPQEIQKALIRVSGSPSIDYPVRILNSDEWSSITQKEAQSEIPSALWADGAYPNLSVYLYPQPTVANSLVLYSLKPLTRIATLDTEVSLPPGYEEAIIYGGAMRLSPEYGRQVSAEVAQIASDSKAAIKRRNLKPIYLDITGVPSGCRGSFNIMTGEYE